MNRAAALAPADPAPLIPVCLNAEVSQMTDRQHQPPMLADRLDSVQADDCRALGYLTGPRRRSGTARICTA